MLRMETRKTDISAGQFSAFQNSLSLLFLAVDSFDNSFQDSTITMMRNCCLMQSDYRINRS